MNFKVLSILLLLISVLNISFCNKEIIEDKTENNLKEHLDIVTFESLSTTSIMTKEVLSKLNDYRKKVGLPNVNLNLTLNEGATLHNDYMYKNKTLTHYQDPSNPAYNPLGANAGLQSILAGNVTNGVEALDLWMNSLYHRQYLLNPELTNIGFDFQKGFATLSLGIDNNIRNNMNNNLLNFTYDYQPIIYPYDGQKDVPLSFNTLESPNPVPDYLSLPTGPFITVNFVKLNYIKNINKVRLTDGNGQRINFTYFIMKNKENILAILPEKPLKPNQKVIVEVNLDVILNSSENHSNPDSLYNYKNTWSFKTISKTS